jgi:F-type H+-transporting ATPase subunit b
MPQLDISTYFNQLFWLIISFSALYYFIAGYFLPGIGGIMLKREDKIKADIAEADGFFNEYKTIKREMENLMAKSRERALALREESALRSKQFLDKKLYDLEHQMVIDMKEQDKRLDAVRLNFRKEVGEISNQLSTEIYQAILSSYQQKANSKVN